MSQSVPIWAQVHSVDPTTGVTTFTNGIVEGTTVTKTDGTQASRNNIKLTFAGLTQDYAGTTAAFDAATTTDTSAFNYTGIIRGAMGHVNIVSSGSTMGTAEGVAGVVFIDPSATGTLSDFYGTGGELVHNGPVGYTVTQGAGLKGQIEITGEGNIGTGWGVYGIAYTSGSTGTFTVSQVGVLGLAQHNTTATVGRSTGGQFYVDLTAGGTVTGAATGVQAYVQSSSTALVSGNAYGVDAHVDWGSSTNLSIAYGIQIQIKNTGGATISAAEGLHILAPTVTQVASAGSNSATRGIRIADQSGAHTGTSTALYIDNQATSGAIAVKTNGGLHQWQLAAATGLAWSISDGTTTLYAIDSRLVNNNLVAHTFRGPAATIASSSGDSYSVIAIPAYTLGTTGTTTINALHGIALNIAAPTINSAGASATSLTSTFYVGGAPSNSGSGSITVAYSAYIAGGASWFGGAVVQSHAPVAVNATATLTAAQVMTGYITCSSTTAVTMTLPTGTLLGAALGAVQGTSIDLWIDNTASSSTGIVTIAVAVNGILSALAAAESGGSGLLTVPVGVTGMACFRLMFSSATAYTFTRIA